MNLRNNKTVEKAVADIQTGETHVNAFKQEAIDAIQEAYVAIGKIETKINALISKYES